MLVTSVVSGIYWGSRNVFSKDKESTTIVTRAFTWQLSTKLSDSVGYELFCWMDWYGRFESVWILQHIVFPSPVQFLIGPPQSLERNCIGRWWRVLKSSPRPSVSWTSVFLIEDSVQLFSFLIFSFGLIFFFYKGIG